jgi:hypothetical protein
MGCACLTAVPLAQALVNKRTCITQPPPVWNCRLCRGRSTGGRIDLADVLIRNAITKTNLALDYEEVIVAKDAKDARSAAPAPASQEPS